MLLDDWPFYAWLSTREFCIHITLATGCSAAAANLRESNKSYFSVLLCSDSYFQCCVRGLSAFLRKQFLASVVYPDQTPSDEWMSTSNSHKCKVIHHVAPLLSRHPRSPHSTLSRYLSLFLLPRHQLLPLLLPPSSSLSLPPLSFHSTPSCFPVWVRSDLKGCPPLGIIRRKRLLLLSAVNQPTARQTKHLQAKHGLLAE